MRILKIEDYNYSIVYVEDGVNSAVYKRFIDGNWMCLNGNSWSKVKNVNELEKLFKKRNMSNEELENVPQMISAKMAAQQELINVLMNQVMDLSMMSKIELGDDVIAEIKRLNSLLK